MKTLIRIKVIRKVLSHLILPVSLGTAMHFGAAPAHAELNVKTYLGSEGKELLAPISNLMATTPTATGTTTATIDYHEDSFNTLPGAPNGENFSILWEGWFDVTKDGQGLYTFGTSSDDGSMLYLDLNNDGDFADSGELIVSNNEYQGDNSATGEVDLQMASVRMAIGYFQGGGGRDMRAAFKKGSALDFDALNLINSASGYFFAEDPYATLAIGLTSPSINEALISGESVTASAFVTDPGAFTHTVTFTVKRTIPSLAIFTVTDASPPFTADFGPLADGTYEIEASVVNSDVPAGQAISPIRTFTVAPEVTTMITLASSASPSTYGDNVIFTATVSPVPTGGTVQFFSGTNALGTPISVNTTTGEASFSTTALNVGTLQINADYRGYQIYEPSKSTSSLSQVINKAPLTVTAQNVFRPLNTANPDPLPYEISGFKNGQNLSTSGVGGTPTLDTTAISTSPVGNYPITCTVGDLFANNYNFVSFVDGTLTVADVADTFSVNFYAEENDPASQFPPGIPAGFGDWFTAGWTNIAAPWGGGLQPAQTLTSNQSSTSVFIFKNTRNGGTTTEYPRTTNLGDGNYTLMASIAHGTEDLNAIFDMEMTNIPFANYDVIFYMGSSHWNGDRAGKIVFNGAAPRPFLIENESFNGTYTNMVDGTTPGNYIIHKGVTGSSFTTQIYGDGFNHIGVAGFQIREVPAPGNTYATWAATNAPGQTPNLDHDKDGVQNGVEYFMGQTGSSFTSLPTLNADNTISWPASATYNGTYEIQTSPDLMTWTNVTPKPIPTGGNLNYTLPPAAPGGKRFVRLFVTPTP